MVSGHPRQVSHQPGANLPSDLSLAGADRRVREHRIKRPGQEFGQAQGGRIAGALIRDALQA